jgi:hypothetical protein
MRGRNGLGVAAVMTLTATVQAATLSVPAEYKTIQAAINAASDGDEILVASGTYNEAIDFLGKAIVVRGAGPATTVIDGTSLDATVVKCISGEGPDTRLEGFTIANGTGTRADEGFTIAGGMRNWNSSPTIVDCVFSQNIVSDAGGGMWCRFGDPTIINCVFTENAGCCGGGIWYFQSSPTIINCVFDRNTASSDGGGITGAVGSVVVINSTFASNIAPMGGGIFNGYPSSPTLLNCVLWGNVPDSIAGPVDVIVRYCDVEGGFTGTGNVDLDPTFVDAANGNLRLQAGSPCIDAGVNAGVPHDVADLDQDGDILELVPRDLDGNARFAADELDFDPGCGVPVVVDMGPYELLGTPGPHPFKLGDVTGDGAVGITDLLELLEAWGACPGCCVADLDVDLEVGILDLLTLLGNWG